MIPKITREAVIDRAWDEVVKVFEAGDVCNDCEHCDDYPGSFMEPPCRCCKLVDTDGSSPFQCPAVTLKDVEETMAAEAEERILRSQGD